MASTQQARIRRLQDTLIIAGGGVIAFGVWSLAKLALFFVFVDESQLRQLLGLGDSIPMTPLYIAAGIVVLIDLAVRAYVGLSARSEGRGQKKSPFYLVVAIFVALLNASSVIAPLFGAPVGLSILDSVVSVVIEATSLTALVLVIYCSVCLRRLDKAKG